MRTVSIFFYIFMSGLALAAEPLFETSDVFPPGMNGNARYRIPGVVVTQEGTVLANCEARKNYSSDLGEIEVQLRRSPIDLGLWPTKHVISKRPLVVAKTLGLSIFQQPSRRAIATLGREK